MSYIPKTKSTLIVVAVVVAFSGAAGALFLALRTNRQTSVKALSQAIEALDRTVTRQAAAARGGCQRLQIVRDDLNVQASVQYRVIKASTDGGPPPEKVKAALARVDEPTRDLLILLLAGGDRARRLYPDILRQTKYLPPTDIRKGCGNPGYRPPRPVPFAEVARCFDADTNVRPKLPCPE